MFDRTVHTEIVVDAPPARVWEILADLGSYCDWNPMIRAAEGDLKPGARLRLLFHPPGTKKRTFRPILTVVAEARELRWRGRPGVPAIIESDHFFILKEKNGNVTLLVHDMVFYGLIAPLVAWRTGRMLLGAFDAMNRALKERAEARNSGAADTIRNNGIA